MLAIVLLLLLALLGVTILYILLTREAGQAMLTYGDAAIELPLEYFVFGLILLFISFYITLRLLGWLWRARTRLSERSSRKRSEKAANDIIKGMLEMSQGNWAKADKLLTRSVNNSSTKILNYLAAARAAQKMGNNEKRDEYLRLAHESAPNSEFAVGLTQAELQYAQGQIEQSLATLGHLRESAPKHSYLLGLTAKCYNKLQDWKLLFNLVPDLRKTRALPDSEVDQFERAALLGVLQQAAEHNNPGALKDTWSLANKTLQADAEMLRTYSNHLRALDNDAAAETVIRKFLDHKWSDELALDYGELTHSNPTKALATAEGWLGGHKENPHLLLTVGRLSKQAELWGKARTYLESAITIKPVAEAYGELAELLERLDDNDAAQECYRKGLDLAMTDNT